MDRVRGLLLSALSAACTCACSGGTETGNPSFSGELSYTGYSSAPLQIGVGTQPASPPPAVATVTNAWLDLASVSFSAATCGANATATIDVPALGIGDHAAGNHNATHFTADGGAFCSADLPFANVTASDVLPASAPAALVGNSFLLSGTLADGTPFAITSSVPPLVTLTSAGGAFELGARQPYTLIAFDFATWLGGVDWSSAARSGAAVVISEAENPQLLAQVRASFGAGVGLYLDRDGDGQLDSSPLLLARGN